MSWLLIDNSNTRTKLALGNDKGLESWRAVIATADVCEKSLADALDGVVYSAVIICSVVPDKAQVMRSYFEPIVPLHFLGHTSPLGMAIDYPEPAQIGADRLANAAGLLTRHGAPAIVVDFGTAVTFDVISNQPAYCGGVIAPGLGAMSGYLPQKTALLKAIELIEPPSAIGKSTVHAMQAGAVFGYRGLVREIIAKLRDEMAGDVRVIATGGDAELIAREVEQIDRVDRDLTLDGLRQVAARVFGPIQG